MLQDTFCFEWLNFIAQASRQGFIGQEELQWNSYETLDAHLTQEWLASVEERKLMPRASFSNRAPKSPQQRQKIAQAVSAKWADPEYREKVVSALLNYHRSAVRKPRKPRPMPSDGAQPPKKKKPITKKVSSQLVKPIKFRKRKPPAYKDPLVNSKLEMIKNIRAQRASVDTRLTQAIQQARLLIAEAEKAAKALEDAAQKSPVVQASLIETRKLIDEALHSLESIVTQKTEDCNVPSVSLSEEVNKENESTFEVGNLSQMVHVNGHTTLSSSVYKFSEDFGYLSLERPVNDDPELHLTNGCASLPFSLNSQMIQHRPSNQERETEQYESNKNETDGSPAEDETLSRSDSPAEDETLSKSESPAEDETLSKSESSAEDETLSRYDTPTEDETLSRSDSPTEDETLSRSDSPTEDETLSRSDSPTEDETQSRSPIATKKWVCGRLVEVSEEQQ
ncbi:hypothetical protein RYX36_032987 [Vicia faba]